MTQLDLNLKPHTRHDPERCLALRAEHRRRKAARLGLPHAVYVEMLPCVACEELQKWKAIDMFRNRRKSVDKNNQKRYRPTFVNPRDPLTEEEWAQQLDRASDECDGPGDAEGGQSCRGQ